MKTWPSHGPDLQYGRLFFQIITSGIVRGSIPKEKFPEDGSDGVFHDTISTFSFVIEFVMNFIIGKNLSDGSLKLSQMTVPETESCRTRFPESRRRAVEFTTALETLEFQRILLCSSNTTRFPSLDTAKTPDLLLRGSSLLATQKTVRTGTRLSQIPTNRSVELGGLKKPNSKKPRLDNTASGSLRNCVDVIVSMLLENFKTKQRRRRINGMVLVMGFMTGEVEPGLW